jgi:hypothetical protein
VNPDAAQLYVYYRARHSDAPALIAAVRELHAHWQAAHPGLVCTLNRRVDDSADALTLIETYAQADGVPSGWRRESEREAAERLGEWIIGERHVEVFVPCA